MNFGGIWHSDTAYVDVPPMASMLIAREVPPAGGDTRVEMEPHVAIPRHEAPPRLPVALGAVDTEENPR